MVDVVLAVSSLHRSRWKLVVRSTLGQLATLDHSSYRQQSRVQLANWLSEMVPDRTCDGKCNHDVAYAQRVQ